MATVAQPRTSSATIEEVDSECLTADVFHSLRCDRGEQPTPIEVSPNVENRRYLEAKRDKLGHRLHHQHLRLELEEEE
jgi:GTP cyclohydrolase II